VIKQITSTPYDVDKALSIWSETVPDWTYRDANRSSWTHDLDGFGHILEDFQVYNGGRIMKVPTFGAYVAHKDCAPRYHMAIETNKHCFFIYTESRKMIHIPCDGHIYELDTTQEHSFVNLGKTDRTHLVFRAPE